MVLEPRSTKVPPGLFQIVGSGDWVDRIPSPPFPPPPSLPRESVPLSPIYILKFQVKICLRKSSAAKQEFKNTWPTLTHSFLSKWAIERASTLLKDAQRVSWRPCQGRAISWFLEQWLFAKPLLGSCFLLSFFQGLVFSPQVATWRMYLAHISQRPSYQHFSSQSLSTPRMSASDLGAPPLANADRCPQSQADWPWHHPASQRQVQEADFTLLAPSLAVQVKPELREEGGLTGS